LEPPPIWLMRQAGRYLPEYRRLRATTQSFLDLCYTPSLAAEATLQPVRRFALDAAILFSDILVVPDALGQAVSFETGEGPRLTPLSPTLTLLREDLDLARLGPVFEAIRLVRLELAENVALIGFCGAPWTVATYMIAGRGSSDQHVTRLFAYQNHQAFKELIDRLVRASTLYLLEQLRAGVDAVQIFDSWAGAPAADQVQDWCVEPIARIVSGIRREFPDAPIVVFPRGAASHLQKFANIAGVDALSLDTNVDAFWADSELPPDFPLQGNVDPIALLAGGGALDRAIDKVRKALAHRPHIVNLGHGILPETPVQHVERLIARVRGRFA
jgi:uroporphyrinogen decarboxylase